MPVDGSLLQNNGSQYIAGLAQYAAQLSPSIGYAKGMQDAASARAAQESNQIDLLKLKYQVEKDDKENLVKQAQLALDAAKANLEERKFVAQTDKDKQQIELQRGQLAIAQGKLDLDVQNSGIDAMYKDAMIKTMEFSRDPSNPNNILALANAQKALNEVNKGDEPLSPQGKLYSDIQSGKLDPDFLNSTETTYDAFGRAVVNFKGAGGNGLPGQPGSSGSALQGQPGGATLTPEGATDLQKKDNDTLKAASDEARAASTSIAQNQIFREALGTFGKSGSILSPAKMFGSQLAYQLGFGEGQKASAGELIQAIGSRLALVLRKDMPGQMSDKDREFLIAAAPSITKTNTGNIALMDAMDSQARLSQMYSSFLDKYRGENGSLNGSSEIWSDYTSIFSLIEKDDSSSVKFKVNQPDKADLEFVYRNHDYIKNNFEAIQKLQEQGFTGKMIKQAIIEDMKRNK